jgi:serine/threonine protein kinase/DNA-binding winged helix-turn-helix (wHTH) protein
MSTDNVTGPGQRVAGHIWRFADCEVDELRRELRVGGRTVDVEAKPWEVLHQLLLHAGEVVTKEELLESVWPGLTVVDGSLATAVSKLRKALGDDTMVVTLPRVGYRLAVPVLAKSPSPPTLPELHLSQGERVPGRDQWRLVRRLDLSPSSEVWLAEHPKTRETRVFKFAPDGVRLKSLKREVTLARLLRDSLGERPDFVRVLEWNFETPPYFVESEYAGPNLAEWAEAQGGLGKIPLERRLGLLVDVARAVAAAHDLDVLHKDLKPGNILISKGPDGKPQIKVADFGSASLLAPARLGALGITNLGFTHTGDAGTLSGTVMYVAPEVFAGQSPSASSDVYALGVLLYQLVVGDFRKPLAPGWEAEVANPLLREDIAEAACGDPARRMKSAGALAERLVNLDRRRQQRDELERARQREQIAQSKQTKARALRVRLALAGVAVLAIAAVIWSFYRSSHLPAAKVKTVAVLPFQNLSADPSLDYLRLALPDEIATTLSHTRGLAVRPSATTSKYGQADLDLQKAGREMGVGTIVAGHFIKAGDQLHITLEAIDLETNRVLWRDKIDAPAQSMIATQVQIALRVRGGLAPALGSPAATDTGGQPKNEEAYDLFLRSVAVPLDPTPNGEAVRMLERAVQLDPTYAPAWVALARRYYVEDHYASGNRGTMKRFDDAVERAFALDPNYIAAGAALVVSRVERGDLARAYQEAEDLVQRRPDSADAHFVLSYTLRFAGLLQESGSHCDAAFLLDAQTQTSGLRSCALVFLLRGDYPRMLNYLNLDRGSDFNKAISIDMLVRQGKEQEALQLGAPHIPQWASYDVLLAYIQHKPLAEIRGLTEAVQASDDPETNYLSAAHLAYSGQTDAALEMLRRAIKGNYCSFPAIESDPFFTNLRAKPEFGEIRSAAIECQNKFLAQRGQRPQ